MLMARYLTWKIQMIIINYNLFACLFFSYFFIFYSFIYFFFAEASHGYPERNVSEAKRFLRFMA